MQLSLIAAYDNNRLIGLNNKQPFYLPNDLKRFYQITVNKTIVMGKNTYHAILASNGKSLPKRKNIVLTRDKLFEAQTITSLDELEKEPGEIIIIGGGQLYATALPLATKLYITEIHYSFTVTPHDNAVYFPSIPLTQWREISRVYYPIDTNNQYAHSFIEYHKI